MKIGIIGTGLIGGSIALKLKEKNFTDFVYGIDQNEEKAITPQTVEPNIFSINKEATAAKIPPIKNNHQLFVPQ